MADYYELLVKEFLEREEFIVRLNVKFSKNKGHSDIDVLAVNSSKSVMVGEVKDAILSTEQIDNEETDFEDSNLKNKVKEITGRTNFSKFVFCWEVKDNVKKYAFTNYKIIIIQFWEIIDSIIYDVQPKILKISGIMKPRILTLC